MVHGADLNQNRQNRTSSWGSHHQHRLVGLEGRTLTSEYPNSSCKSIFTSRTALVAFLLRSASRSFRMSLPAPVLGLRRDDLVRGAQSVTLYRSTRTSTHPSTSAQAVISEVGKRRMSGSGSIGVNVVLCGRSQYETHA